MPQGGIDLRFRHDEREGWIEGLGFSRRVEESFSPCRASPDRCGDVCAEPTRWPWRAPWRHVHHKQNPCTSRPACLLLSSTPTGASEPVFRETARVGPAHSGGGTAMRRAPTTHILRSPIAVTLLLLAGAISLSAQQTAPAATAFAPVPRLVWFSGTFQPADEIGRASCRERVESRGV